ncbi:MAG: hypothetical protein WBC33_06355 [Conexibacter sp.]
MARLVALVAVAVALAATPAAVLAAPQQNPFLPQQEQPRPSQVEEAPQQAPAPVVQQDTGMDSGTATLLIIAALALLAGIWVVIARDARRATAGRVRVRSARAAEPFEVPQGGSATRASRKSRKLSAEERRRRKRGRAR